MLDFMDYVHTAFYRTSGWNVDNSYAALTSTSTNLLDFPIPRGIGLHVSALSTPSFATSYTLGSRGIVDGSVSFLYSSLGLNVVSQSSELCLNHFVNGYRHLQELGGSNLSGDREEKDGPDTGPRKNALLYGRLYLPSSTLEASYQRRISSTRLLRLNCVSDAELPHGGTALALLQNDYGKYSTEYLFSTDSALLGVRGLYNLGYDPRFPEAVQPAMLPPPAHLWDRQSGRLSAGAEAYFSPINKSGGLSTGLRFTTLPGHAGFPYTMAVTVNPLMGNLSSSYAVQAGRNLALCSRFDFNVYSYESDVVVGMELWQREPPSPDLAWAVRMLRPGWTRPNEEMKRVWKARLNNHGKIGMLWECRVKKLLVSFGAGIDLRKRDRMVDTVGLEVGYSS